MAFTFQNPISTKSTHTHTLAKSQSMDTFCFKGISLACLSLFTHIGNAYRTGSRHTHTHTSKLLFWFAAWQRRGCESRLALHWFLFHIQPAVMRCDHQRVHAHPPARSAQNNSRNQRRYTSSTAPLLGCFSTGENVKDELQLISHVASLLWFVIQSHSAPRAKIVISDAAKLENHVSRASQGPTVGVDVKPEHVEDTQLSALCSPEESSLFQVCLWAGEGNGPLNSNPSTLFDDCEGKELRLVVAHFCRGSSFREGGVEGEEAMACVGVTLSKVPFRRRARQECNKTETVSQHTHVLCYLGWAPTAARRLTNKLDFA